MACDFCAWGDPIWSYPCKDFQTDEINVVGTNVSMDSHKNWLACNDCSTLIEEENLNELASRSFASSIDSPSRLRPDQKELLMGWIRNTHIQFMRNRTGPRQPWKGADEDE